MKTTPLVLYCLMRVVGGICIKENLKPHMNSNGLSVYIEGSNWDGLTEQGDGFYVHQEIDIPIGLVGDQWKIILIALEHYKNNHLPYEDDCGLYGIEFFDNLISWIRKGLQ